MAVYPSQAMLTKNVPGSLSRKKAEERTKTEALPQGKGGLGSLSRELVQEPIDRPVAPGAKKVVGVKPSVEEAGGGLGFLPAESQSVPGEVSGPESMGMMAKAPSSGVSRSSVKSPSAPKATTNAPAKASASVGKYGTPVSVSAPKAQSGASKATLSSYLSGGLIAGPSERLAGTPEQVEAARKAEKSVKKAESQRPSEQAVRAANTKLTPKTASESVKKLISNPIQEAPKAVKGIAERVKETVTNAKKGAGTYNRSVNAKESTYNKAVKALEKAKSVLRSITKGFLG